MSAIDAYDHVHIGYFNEIPMYWLQEECKRGHITNEVMTTDRRLNKNHIIIGGGSGEHPALVIPIHLAVFWALPSSYSRFGEYIDLNDWTFEQHVKAAEYMKCCFKEKYDDIDLDNFDYENCLLTEIGNFVLSELPLSILPKDHIISYYNDVKVYSDTIMEYCCCRKLSETDEVFGKRTTNGKTIFKYSLQEWLDENKDTI